jgi:hypothetical protein
MTDLVTQIKDKFPLASIVAPYTGGLRPPVQTNYGQYLNGWCPWCQNGNKQPDHPKRFWVNTETSTCNCFNPACCSPVPMDVINFWARIHQISNEQAIQDLGLMVSNVQVIR